MKKSLESKRAMCASVFSVAVILFALNFVGESAFAKLAPAAATTNQKTGSDKQKLIATQATAKKKKRGEVKDDEVDLSKTSLKGSQKITCGEKGSTQQVVYEARRGQWIDIYNAKGEKIGRAADARLMADVDDSSICESLKPSGFKSVDLTAIKNVATVEAVNGERIAQMTPASPFAGVDMSGNPMMYGMGGSPMYFGNLDNMLLSSTGDDDYDRLLRNRSYEDEEAQVDHRLEVASVPPTSARTGPYVDMSGVPPFLSSPVCDCLGGCGMSSDFGPRTAPYISPGVYGSDYHGGNDLLAPLGTHVIASADGIVKDIGSNASEGCGIWVLIEHAPGIETKMCHMNPNLKVSKGQPLRRGALIGYSGKTGPTGTKIHLHYEVRINNVPVDPQGKLALSSKKFAVSCSDPNPGAIAQNLPVEFTNPAARALASPGEVTTQTLSPSAQGAIDNR